MAMCKDCFHCDVCEKLRPIEYCMDITCSHFKNKADVIVLPCKDGTKVVVIESRTSNGKNLYIFEDRVTHYRICYDVNIMCLENHLGVPHWNWDKVFFGENARERAEQKLKEMRNDNG